jgi:membrane protease YdiL (CAAX protease family)
MTYDTDTPEPLPAVAPFGHRGHSLLAWLIILAVVALVVWGQLGRRAAEEPNAPAASAHRQLPLELQARVLVGTTAIQGKSSSGSADPAKQVEALNTGSGDQRLCAAVIAGELLGPEAAHKQLAAMQGALAERHIPLTLEQEKLRRLLLHLYTDYKAARWNGPSVGESEREVLRRELGWFGELALAPAAGPDKVARAAVLAPAQRTALTGIIFGLGFVVVAAAGLLALFLLLVFLTNGRCRARFQTGSPAGGIYAETFALWLVLFGGLSLLVYRFRLTEYGILLLGLPGLISLLTLAWPVLRGYSWRQVRREIGLGGEPRGVSPRLACSNRGLAPLGSPRVVRELVFGLITYAMALPLLVVGLLVMLLLVRVQSVLGGAGGPGTPLDPGDMPSHPIVDVLVNASGWQRAQLFILACVIAPLVEETMFRGVLYRHLREATSRLSLFVSFLLSATVVSFLFAVVHPQGFLAIPVLMALAYAFALAREWRDTLLPSMVAHGLNNGVAFTIFLLLMSP